jgi:hypothetical protein
MLINKKPTALGGSLEIKESNKLLFIWDPMAMDLLASTLSLKMARKAIFWARKGIRSRISRLYE